MRIRISKTVGEDRTLVRVEGELIDQGVGELEQTCARVKVDLTLDLGDLYRVDPCGILVLKDLASRGARLINMNPYVEMLLRTNGNGTPTQEEASGT